MFDHHYRDFYQTALIPIDNLSTVVDANYTHWLIALSGRLKDSQKEYYIWKVVVYPADSEGSFEWLEEPYSTESYDCFHKACESAREIEQNIRNQEFVFVNLKERIS
ncbi:hypothetical protein SM124_02180 [Bacillus sp. 31A1R]|uniref:Uncharacterized protein n=1 Tax=Robertmurraya mangrovi TaxID=3098077 RepID=A0ABU5ITU6_9BACI|nr:hypothetical protein [Bacillus sp. 31A1R]MDZ5470548.1 hypothetical protein [Bacillus sp. 31A1R]